MTEQSQEAGMSEAICTWPSCGHTAKGQCGLRLVFDPVTRSAVRINPPPDLPPTLSADLIRLRAEVATLRAGDARMREALTIAETTIADLERANASYQSALSERGIDGSKGTEE